MNTKAEKADETTRSNTMAEANIEERATTNGADTTNDIGQEPQNQRKRKRFWILGCVGLLLVVAAVIIIALLKTKTTTSYGMPYCTQEYRFDVLTLDMTSSSNYQFFDGPGPGNGGDNHDEDVTLSYLFNVCFTTKPTQNEDDDACVMFTWYELNTEDYIYNNKHTYVQMYGVSKVKEDFSEALLPYIEYYDDQDCGNEDCYRFMIYDEWVSTSSSSNNDNLKRVTIATAYNYDFRNIQTLNITISEVLLLSDGNTTGRTTSEYDQKTLVYEAEIESKFKTPSESKRCHSYQDTMTWKINP